MKHNIHSKAVLLAEKAFNSEYNFLTLATEQQLLSG